jgi:hypothetical protein
MAEQFLPAITEPLSGEAIRSVIEEDPNDPGCAYARCVGAALSGDVDGSASCVEAFKIQFAERGFGDRIAELEGLLQMSPDERASWVSSIEERKLAG